MPIKHVNVAWAEVYIPAKWHKWHLDISSRLARLYQIPTFWGDRL